MKWPKEKQYNWKEIVSFSN